MTRKRINLQDEIAAAINDIRERDRKERERLGSKGETDDKWYSRACYFVARDVEYEVRDRVRRAFGSYDVQIRGLRGQSLLTHCRKYLSGMVARGELDCYNPSGFTATGLRFREPGTGLTDCEKRTAAAKKKEKPVHLGSGGNPCCTRVKSEKQLARRTWGGRPKKPGYVRTTDKRDDVTCPRCRKLIDAEVTVVYPDPDGEGVNWKCPEGTLPEFVEKLPLHEVLSRSRWSAPAEKRMNGEFSYNSLSVFVLTREEG